MEASTASACLRRLSLFVNSVRRSQAVARSSIYSNYGRFASRWRRHLSMDFLENTHCPSTSSDGMLRSDAIRMSVSASTARYAEASDTVIRSLGTTCPCPPPWPCSHPPSVNPRPPLSQAADPRLLQRFAPRLHPGG